jgi:hypothetical protein
VSPRKYLDIGIPSLKNLNGWKRKVLFTCLVLPTVPLHFLWNSVVFTTTQNVDCNVFVVTPSFFNDSTVDCIQKVSMYNQGSVSDTTRAAMPQTTRKLHFSTAWESMIHSCLAVVTIGKQISATFPSRS